MGYNKKIDIMEFKGTKGQWAIRNSSPERVSITTENNGDFIDCWGEGIADVNSEEEALANATLIAAAPDLLEVLQELVNANPMHEGYHEKKLKGIAAIEKALTIK